MFFFGLPQKSRDGAERAKHLLLQKHTLHIFHYLYPSVRPDIRPVVLCPSFVRSSSRPSRRHRRRPSSVRPSRRPSELFFTRRRVAYAGWDHQLAKY